MVQVFPSTHFCGPSAGLTDNAKRPKVCVPHNWNERLEITLVPRDKWRPVVSEEGGKPAAPGF